MRTNSKGNKIARLSYRPSSTPRHRRRVKTDEGASGPQREVFEWALIGTRMR